MRLQLVSFFLFTLIRFNYELTQVDRDTYSAFSSDTVSWLAGHSSLRLFANKNNGIGEVRAHDDRYTHSHNGVSARTEHMSV